MYWPIGAPRIYAACNSGNASKAQIYHSDDDAESRETTESGSFMNASSATSDAAQDDDGFVTAGQTLSPQAPGVQSVEHDAQRRLSLRGESGSVSNGRQDDAIREAERQPLLALKMSRSGNLFAVITATSMTIWQTKVSIHALSELPGAC